MSPRRLLEVCVDSPAGLVAAVQAGADRIELCSSLALQGLTPTPGLMALASRQPIPAYPMIRAHPGEFRYEARDVDVMRWDIDAARAAGLPGVVIGANTASGELDEDVLAALVEHAKGLGLTLHRAFDLVPDFARALETAIALGFERILTSGGARNALLGADRIAEFVAQAGGRIRVMAGCGVTPANIAEIVRRTGVHEVHGSFGARVYAPEGPEIPGDRAADLGFAMLDRKDTLGASVAEAAGILKTLG
ncbi:copper homeostasis protein CutC [Phenylobacterium montanum]|uniref:PF03932 family protein CutC n=1 Tax=Phenylobacterium montanum TaxID=2823693 RepID=A0A975FYN1_9CAUL|nr:copper homeostasis protein CutC [Caulobacter sp. S6]QUD87700.1 copper homeostasis protein CutC [Caulobacter sp. S6]